MISVVIDTSFFVKCAEYGIDLFSEFERVIPSKYELVHVSGTREELESLSEGKSALSRNAKLAKAFLQRTRLMVVDVEGIVDDRILVAVQNLVSPVVATHDVDLKRKAKAVGAGLVVIRQRKVFEYSPKAL